MGRHRQTHCKRGHPLTDETTVREPQGWGRTCLECRRAKDRARYHNNPERKQQVIARANNFNRNHYHNIWGLPPASQWLPERAP